MHYVLLGLLLALLAYAGFRAFLTTNPKTMAANLRKIGGIAALLLAGFFAATGRFPVAIPLGIFAFSLLARNLGAFGGGATKSEGQRSRVRTKTVEMELDHDSGEMDGRVLNGKFAGRALSAMTQNELVELWLGCRKRDPQAGQLIEAYMDRRFADWRDTETASASGGDSRTGAPADGPMTVEEAYEVLGLAPDASKADVRRAHRTLMKKLHPDHGGSTYLAAKINQAKDLLLGQ